MKRKLKGLVKRGVGQSTQRPNDPIERIILSAAGLTRQPTNENLDEAAAAVMRAAKPLLEIAMTGNVHAIRRVTEIAASLAAESMMLACMHQDAANQVARERTTWPLNLSNDPAERRRTLRLVTGPRRLPLGERSTAAAPVTKPGGFSAPANAAVLMAIKAIQIERTFRVPSELFPALQPEWSVVASQLPELDGSAVVADQWFDVIWLYVCHRYEGVPEKSALRRLAEHEGPRSASPAHDAAVRAAIRETLREAFLKMIRKRRR